MRSPEKSPVAFIGVKMPEQTAAALRRRAAARGWTVSHFIRVAVDAALAAADRSAR